MGKVTIPLAAPGLQPVPRTVERIKNAAGEDVGIRIGLPKDLAPPVVIRLDEPMFPGSFQASLDALIEQDWAARRALKRKLWGERQGPVRLRSDLEK